MQVRLNQLQPGATYYYRFSSREGSSPVGRFRTLRRASDPAPVRVAYFACQHWQAGYYTAHAGLAAEPDLDLALCLGDYIYELGKDQGPLERVDTIGVAGEGFAETLGDYRAKYRLYRSDPNLQAMHAAHGFEAVWDNHELAEDGGHLRGRVPTVPLASRIANGKQAFWDFMPMTAGPAERPLYRSLRLGANLEIFLLDTHSYCDPPATFGTYLGKDQLAWLLAGLSSSTARWKAIASTTLMMGLDLTRGLAVNTNQWDGYPDERCRIVKHIRESNIQGVVALSGDIHTFLVGPVTTTGRVDGEAGLVEFNCGAISSMGFLSLTPDQVQVARGLEHQASLINPVLRFIDVVSRGYSVLEARPDELLVTLRSPQTTFEPSSPTRDLAVFRLRHGSLDVERVA
jgi:alkaline phosphatase D